MSRSTNRETCGNMHKDMSIAIFGAGGMLGRYVTEYMKREKYNITPYYRRDFDILKDNVKSLPKFDYVVNCAGIIKQRECDPNDLFFINAVFPQLLHSYRIGKLIQISTDCVFDNPIGGNRVEDMVDAVDDYGFSKVSGERGMVIRTSIIGEGNPLGLLDWALSQDKVNGYTNHYWNGITCLELARHIPFYIGRYQPNTIHLHGYTYTKYDLLKKIYKVYGKSSVVEPCESTYVNRTLRGTMVEKKIEVMLEEQRVFFR